jgi:dephospho-CoA kinase
MQIIGFVGPQGGGKSTATEYVKTRGYTILEMNTAAVEEAERLGIEPNKVNLPAIGTRLRKELGQNYAAEHLCMLIDKRGLKKIVISGIRSNFEIDYFRKKFFEFKVAAITAPLELRYERTKDRFPSKEAFLKREEEENKWGIAEGLKSADITIENTGTEEDFLKNVDTWLSNQK